MPHRTSLPRHTPTSPTSAVSRSAPLLLFHTCFYARMAGPFGEGCKFDWLGLGGVKVARLNFNHREQIVSEPIGFASLTNGCSLEEALFTAIPPPNAHLLSHGIRQRMLLF